MDDQVELELLGRAWPTSPPAPIAEQREAPIEGTIQAEYEAWRQTEPGVRVWAFIQQKARELSAAVPPDKRKKGVLSVDWLVQLARGELHLSINNDFRSILARDLVEALPGVGDLIERRRRTAA